MIMNRVTVRHSPGTTSSGAGLRGRKPSTEGPMLSPKQRLMQRAREMLSSLGQGKTISHTTAHNVDSLIDELNGKNTRAPHGLEDSEISCLESVNGSSIADDETRKMASQLRTALRDTRVQHIEKRPGPKNGKSKRTGNGGIRRE